ncbi:MAG: bacterial proteasome activator family protein [Actinomycetota bacterium]|nr:bacterial proteasome activator family protein [Actinomycetota bacterium]
MSDQPSATEAPGVIPAIPVETQQPPGAQEESITQPAKLLRIASMVRELLEQTRQASLDEPGRKRLADIYGRAVGELAGVLSPDLRDELGQLAPPIDSMPTEAELRVAQAQLVGWLEGLFHGIQAAMFAQQAAAQAQFQELQRRGLMAQNPPGAPGEPDAQDPRRPGQYL